MAYTLAPGARELVAPLDPAQWSSVLGKRGTDGAAARHGFEAGLAQLGNVGMTFGGGCFFGHGVFVTGGTARFITTEYVVK